MIWISSVQNIFSYFWYEIYDLVQKKYGGVGHPVQSIFVIFEILYLDMKNRYFMFVYNVHTHAHTYVAIPKIALI